MADKDPDLSELRDRLSAIDRRIIELVAERQGIAESIGRVKQSRGRGTRDFGREKQVLELARGTAREHGLSTRMVEALMQLLIQSSLTHQEKERVRAEGQGRGQRALVIGGAGKMGRWFTEFLDSQGFSVTVADPAGEVPGFAWHGDWREAPDEFDVSVIAAPLRATAAILAEFGRLGRRGLVFDVGSVKAPLIEALKGLAAAGGRVTSLHPMFGPDTELLSGRHVLFLDCGCQAATAEARRLFASTMARQIEMEIAEHDRLVAWVLGLSHALNIAFFTALADSGEAVPRLADISSTTFDAQLDVAARVAAENPHLYFEIQTMNPHGTAPLDELLGAMNRIASAVRDGDEQGFVTLMRAGQAYLAGRRDIAGGS